MTTIGIVAGGPKEELPDLNAYKTVTTWVGVDEGCLYILDSDQSLEVAIGDFDSVTQAEFNRIKRQTDVVKKVAVEKDQTDLELAISYVIDLEPSLVYIFGATGGRLDHAWMNMQLTHQFDQNSIESWICNKDNELTLKHPGTHIIKFDPRFSYISFLSMTELVANFTVKDLKYDLSSKDIVFGSSLTISNEWTGKNGTYSFSSGILLVIKSRD
ncbi:thiamine diphosphokinase [Halalkalibacillus halophilus]|uniref:thiamine diphosphokinase n=1 Tax=Halalkalibacillus halophilus TaxID=392827 RepID=UPI00041C6DC7|nr:thiamine diphosphokinase [Halalkalibacillus halophilus]